MPCRRSVLQQLVGTVEAHRLAIEQRAGEGRRLVALEPAAGVGEQGEAGRVRLRETVAAEALDLLEDARGELRAVAARQHPGGQRSRCVLQSAVALPRRHRTTQLVGLAGRVAGRDDGQLHHLLLEQRHAQRALEHLAKRFRGIGHRLLAVPPAQVGMHHVALDRTRAHDRHLDHQVVERARLQARQHRHLRARFDLEHADGVGAADHVVGGRVFRRDRRQGQVARRDGRAAGRGSAAAR